MKIRSTFSISLASIRRLPGGTASIGPDLPHYEAHAGLMSLSLLKRQACATPRFALEEGFLAGTARVVDLAGGREADDAAGDPPFVVRLA